APVALLAHAAHRVAAGAIRLEDAAPFGKVRRRLARRPRLVLEPRLKAVAGLGNDHSRHVGMLEPAIFGALAAKDAGTIGGQPAEVHLAGDKIGLAGELRHPEG